MFKSFKFYMFKEGDANTMVRGLGNTVLSLLKSRWIAFDIYSKIECTWFKRVTLSLGILCLIYNRPNICPNIYSNIFTDLFVHSRNQILRDDWWSTWSWFVTDIFLSISWTFFRPSLKTFTHLRTLLPLMAMGLYTSFISQLTSAAETFLVVKNKSLMYLTISGLINCLIHLKLTL